MRKIRVKCEGVQFTLHYDSANTTQLQAIKALFNFFPYAINQKGFLNWHGNEYTVINQSLNHLTDF